MFSYEAVVEAYKPDFGAPIARLIIIEQHEEGYRQIADIAEIACVDKKSAERLVREVWTRGAFYDDITIVSDLDFGKLRSTKSKLVALIEAKVKDLTPHEVEDAKR